MRVRAWRPGSTAGQLALQAGKIPLHGQVSLATQGARFRNVWVTALDGKELHAGLPSPARHWRFYSPGALAIDAGRPLNGMVAAKLTGNGGESGLLQDNLQMRVGDACHGSLWARGAAVDRLVMRLLDGPKVLAERSCPHPEPIGKRSPSSSRLRPTWPTPRSR